MTPTSEGGFPEGSFCTWIGASPGREQRVFTASSGDERRRGLQTLPGQCRAVSKRGSVVTDWSRARGGHGGGGRAVAGPGGAWCPGRSGRSWRTGTRRPRRCRCQLTDCCVAESPVLCAGARRALTATPPLTDAAKVPASSRPCTDRGLGARLCASGP